jgi:hypothetical protein
VTTRRATGIRASFAAALLLGACTPAAAPTPTPDLPAATPGATAPATSPGLPSSLAPGASADGRVHETVVTLPAGHNRLPIALLDRTGLVVEITEVPQNAAFTEGIVGAEDGRALVFTWVGGSCDLRVLLTLERSAAGFRLLTRTDVTGQMCDMLGVSRQVAIRLSEPIAPETVIVERAP